MLCSEYELNKAYEIFTVKKWVPGLFNVLCTSLLSVRPYQ